MNRIKTASVCAVAALMLLGATSCKKHKVVETRKYELNDTVYLTEDRTNSIAISLDIEFPTAAPTDSALRHMRNYIERQLFSPEYMGLPIDAAMAAYREELVEEYRETNLPVLEQMGEEDFEDALSGLNNEHMLTAYTMYNTPQAYTYAIERYVFTGGPHGINTRLFYNFQANTGKLISQDELFVEGYENMLTQLIIQSLIEQDDDMALVSDLKKSDYEIDAIHPNDNFYLSEEGVTYVFNPYEIGPYYLGETEILVAKEKLSTLIRPEWQVLFTPQQGK